MVQETLHKGIKVDVHLDLSSLGVSKEQQEVIAKKFAIFRFLLFNSFLTSNPRSGVVGKPVGKPTREAKTTK